MWPWVLAGSTALLNVATILIVIAIVRLHRRGGPEGGERIGQDVAELVEQLDRLADHIDARLERRSAVLERQLAAADARIAELRRLTETPGLTRSVADESLAISPSESGLDPRGRRAEILRLVRQDVDPVEIARRLHIDVGEVELVVHLDRSTT